MPLTVEELAELLGEKPAWVYERVRSERLPAVHLGRYVRFFPEDVAWCIEHLEELRLPPERPERPVKDRHAPTYTPWSAMRRRCSNPNATSYAYYGGREITVCARWDSYESFLADMGERPEGKTIDRINNDGNYEPGNCRWATPKEQAANKRKGVPKQVPEQEHLG